MNSYHVFGTINTFFTVISVYGVYSQLNTIWRRKINIDIAETPTALLSINQFTVSYLAYFSFFIYGYSIEPFNHYMVWPRLIATLIVGTILYEIWRDRKDRRSWCVFLCSIICLLLGMAGLFWGHTFVDEGRQVSTIIIVVISLLIAQGYFHQIRLIVRSGSTGAVDLKMSQFIFMMDISTILFALSMGMSIGWPLMLLAITSATTKIVIMYLFHWVNTSDIAQHRREYYLRS
ncbi:hypothetical protein HQQ94_11310 [Shewanella sp. VB17]|uniref:hypothetical protein n=1 Tax=Shewanella sp. VB17 TaxID=2739432 RepID=UPI0015653139|nr:hypothetical protein [Shewanella sp. VB17]NRD73815.1 hypothetical protein [Shewanella sp. VB17]